MLFRLSNTQKKELLIRATPLRIALPTPPEDPDNWLQWARRSLLEEGKYVTGVFVDRVFVTTPSIQGLGSVIGSIVHGEPADDNLTWGVDAAICNLDPPAPPRHGRLPVQWPLYAEHNGVRWPSATGTDWKSRCSELMDALKCHRHAVSEDTIELMASVQAML